MPTDFSAICPLKLSDINETHIRAHGSNFFFGRDMFLTRGYSFICEFYRPFSIY